MAAEQKKPREAAQDHRAGAESLFSRPSPRSRRRVRLDEPQDDGIHIPGGTVPTPTTSDGGSKPSRVGDAGKSYRSATEWPTGGARGSAGAAPEGRRDGRGRSELEHGAAPRAHTGSSGLADNRAGEEESGPDGARPREAQRASVEGAKAGQIGTRRRDESRAITRDAMERGAERGEGDSAEEASGAGRNAPRDQEGRPPERKGGRLESTRKRGVEADAKERKRQRPGSPGSLVEPRGSGEGRRKPEEEPDTPQTIEEQESFETIGLEEEADHSLQVLKAWLQSEECGGLTISQSGALLALTAFRSGTPLGILLGRMVRPGSDDGEERSRQRSLLPLPLWKDSRDALAALFDSGEFRRLAGSWATKKANKEKAARLSRRNGLLIWHGLVVTLINHLWSGGGSKAAVCLQEPSKAQTGALDRLWIVVRDFVDDTSESKEKVLKSPPLGDWATKLADVRISYHGEIVEKSHQLTLDQVKPGLPPSGYGASVPLVELCDGELQEKLMKPLANLLPEDELPADIPKPKVHANQEQWNLIARDLMKEG